MASNAKPVSNSREPEDSDFKQQRLKAWQPLLTPNAVITIFFIFSIIFAILGGLIVTASNNIVETEPARYEKCSGECTVEVRVKEKMKSPVYVYYELTKFYQNHRRYVRSRNDDQLRGEIVTDFAALEYCDPLKKPDGAPESPEFYYNPCGLIANSWFNDTFAMMKEDGTTIDLIQKGISWKSDRDVKFKNPDEYVGVPPPRYVNRNEFNNYENETFIVWMRTAALPRFKKLYAKIDVDLQPGNYRFLVQSDFDVKSFDGTKAIVLSTADWIGGKNYFLGWAYVSMSVISFTLSVVFFSLNKWRSPRQFGDHKYLTVKAGTSW
eukprot:TRINITY_DN14440_c0_g1_i1.p1 TRINITY_DN14440_c0_g1~~TRINITY_DN14440_c0_g1_i1.p1  ORF type:complete len:323 (-),score=80.29 TRINITY_DN14440_c0_g1_i1:533-1501(-)